MAMVRLSMSVWPVAPRSAAEGGLGGARADVECSATPLGWACSRSSRSRTPQGLSATADAITLAAGGRRLTTLVTMLDTGSRGPK
uniref:Uncharacterized protein n=2 Tax=Oryza TaxID=4527 RepID=Q339M3_ORYSJ|nr:hypothetical protein LOC_Os10g20340 [Oryza sativa Japonica Group]